MKKLIVCCSATILAVSAFAAAPLTLTPKNIDKVIKAMTLEEKAHLVVGARMNDNKKAAGEVGYTRKIIPGAAGTTYPVPRLGIPPIVVADGPAGLRINPTREGDSQTYYCTGFPVGIHKNLQGAQKNSLCRKLIFRGMGSRSKSARTF